MPPESEEAMMRPITLLAVTALALGVSAGAGSVSVANALYEYECTSCAKDTGPNESIHINRGVNQSGTGVCSAIWKYNGGTNYNVVAEECTSSKSVIWAESGKVTGHGEVRRWYAEFLYSLQGLQE
jgi:hypothetical protein